MDKELTYTVREADLADTAGGLVNLLLKKRLRLSGHEISRSKFLPNGITADGVPVTVKARLLPGQTLRIVLPDGAAFCFVPRQERVVPVRGPLSILYEDEDLIALDKPAGTVCHPSHGHYFDSLANFLAAYYQEKGQAVTCHVIGRLDKDTSGVLVFAKNRPAAARLTRQRADHIFRRTYLALARGRFIETAGGGDAACPTPIHSIGSAPSARARGDADAFPAPSCDISAVLSALVRGDAAALPAYARGTISLPLGPLEGALMKQRVYASDELNGLRAVTHYEVLAERDSAAEGFFSLLRLELETGRTHQIRVHLAALGHPLVGDSLYGESTDALLPCELPDDLQFGELSGASLLGAPQYSNCQREALSGTTTHQEANAAVPHSRALLHACQVELRQPFTGERLTLTAPLPEDFARRLRCTS